MAVKRGSADSSISKTIFPSSRGQVTVFIIIGIIIVFTFAGILYFTKTSTKESFADAGQPVIADVPQEFQPLQLYTENCLQRVGKQGLQLLGQQGGYIYPELLGDYSTLDPTESSGIAFDSMKVPYWYYNPEQNPSLSASISSLRPELSGRADLTVEAQLSRFVQEQLETCLGGYAPFTTVGFNIKYPQEQEGKEVDVKVGDSSVNFWLKMPVKATKGDAETSLDQFYVRIPLKLKHYYAIAKDIADAQQKFGFLENQMLGLVTAFSAPSKDKLPPTDAVSFDLVSTTFWPVPELKVQIKNLLTSYVPLLQFYGSHNLYRYEYPERNLRSLHQQNYDNMIIPLRGAEDVEVRFDYFGWEPYVNFNDQDGLVKPQSVFMEPQWGLTPPLGIQRYYTTYDISYPVLVSIDDPLAFDGEGYQFIIALEANIRNNKRVSGEQTLAPPLMVEKSIACEANQRTTELLRTIVVDASTGRPVEAVRIGFTIPEQDECTMGITDEDGMLESRYPAVYGGVVNFIKEEYLTAFYPIDTYSSEQSSNNIIGYASASLGTSEPVIELYPFKTINVSVQKKDIGKCLRPLECDYTIGVVGAGIPTGIPYKEIQCSEGPRQCFFDEGLFGLPKHLVTFNATGSFSKFNDYYYLGGNGKSLRDTEQVFVTLTKIKDINPNIKLADYSVTFDLTGNSKSEIRLVPGVYKVTGLLTLNEKVKIPTDDRSIKIDIPLWDTDEHFKINGSELEKYIEGMIAWDTPATYFTVTADQLYGSQELVFHFPVQDFQQIPEYTTTTVRECGSVTCLPGVGCAFEVCTAKDQKDVGFSRDVDTKLLDFSSGRNYVINGRVTEDTQLLGVMTNISTIPEVRQDLEPVFR